MAVALGLSLAALAFLAGRYSAPRPGNPSPSLERTESVSPPPSSGPRIMIDPGAVDLLPDAALTIQPQSPPAPLPP